MKLVDDWRDFWRWHSTWLAAVLAAAPMAWSQMPEDIKAMIPAGWEPYIAAGLFVAYMAGRLREQPDRG